jgi:hypothetical protein
VLYHYTFPEIETDSRFKQRHRKDKDCWIETWTHLSWGSGYMEPGETSDSRLPPNYIGILRNYTTHLLFAREYDLSAYIWSKYSSRMSIVVYVLLMCLSGYGYRLVTWSNSMKPEGLYGEFGHAPTGIYIPIDTLKWYLITYIYICDRQPFPILKKKCLKIDKMLKFNLCHRVLLYCDVAVTSVDPE